MYAFPLGEFGDYDPAEHGTDYLDDFPLLENRVRSETSVYVCTQESLSKDTSEMRGNLSLRTPLQFEDTSLIHFLPSRWGPGHVLLTSFPLPLITGPRIQDEGDRTPHSAQVCKLVPCSVFKCAVLPALPNDSLDSECWFCVSVCALGALPPLFSTIGWPQESPACWVRQKVPGHSVQTWSLRNGLSSHCSQSMILVKDVLLSPSLSLCVSGCV